MLSGSARRWNFVRYSDNSSTSWVWQRFGADGLEKTSEPYASYGKALMAALQNGFRPDYDTYSIDLPHGRMDFLPGSPPEFAAARPVSGQPSA